MAFFIKQRIGTYLIDTIHRTGVDKILGVPGDFDLAFLDDIISSPDVNRVENTNELDAGYATDDYTRLSGLAALVTTFDVGELSAINGIVGSYAERIPVIAITGTPTHAIEQGGKYVHHSLGEGTFGDYREMFAHVTVAQGYITPGNATTEIPCLVNTAIVERRPVYLRLSIGVAISEIEMPTPFEVTTIKYTDVSTYIELLATKLHQAKQPVAIAGHEINSFHLHQELEDFVNQAQIPVAQLSLGKGASNEENPYYIGIYDGKIAEDKVRDYVDSSGLVLNIGAKLTDSATTGFSYQFNIDDVVMLNHHSIKIDDATNDEISLPSLLKQLSSISYTNNATFPAYHRPVSPNYTVDTEPLTQQTYFKMMQNFLKPSDVIIADQGTLFSGAYDLALYRNNTFIEQLLWGSIGYISPATLGSQLTDKNRCNLLLIGDGSLQLTIQAISTMIRQHIKPVLFVINNDGYTIERLTHGTYEPYNEIHMWDYKALPAVSGGKNVKIHDVKSSKDLQDTFNAINGHPDVMYFVEVKMAVRDAPKKLIDIVRAFSQQNK